MKKGKWPEEVPRVVWSHNTTNSRTTGFTPIRLLYGEEVVMPEEIKLGSNRTSHPNLEPQNEAVTKDIMEIGIFEASKNLKSYQKETENGRTRLLL